MFRLPNKNGPAAMTVALAQESPVGGLIRWLGYSTPTTATSSSPPRSRPRPPGAASGAWACFPSSTTRGLEGLQKALEENQTSLLTGATTFPPPLQCTANEPVEKCCPLCYALLDGKRPEAVSVGPLETRFAEACWNADERTGIPGGIRYFLNWIDTTSWGDVRKELLAEVKLALAERSRQQRPEPLSPLAHLLGESIRLAEQLTPA